MSNTTHESCCVRGHIHEGTPLGETTRLVNDLETYVFNFNGNGSGKRTKTALLFLTDIYSIQLLNAQLLADKFGQGSKLDVYVPDFFRGKAAPPELITAPEGQKPDFDVGSWIQTIDAMAQCKDAAAVVDQLHNELGYECVGVVGFCWGAQLVNYLCSKESPVKVDFGSFAHPSLTKIEDYEKWNDDVESLFITCENDVGFPLDMQAKVKVIMAQKPRHEHHHFIHFHGMTHGFTVRGKCAGDESEIAANAAHKNFIRFFKANAKY